MYLKSIELKNIKSMDKYRIVFQKGNYAGWHVIIGENGAGKSSLARVIALCIIAYLSRKKEVFALRLNWERWLSDGADMGSIRAGLLFAPGDKVEEEKIARIELLRNSPDSPKIDIERMEDSPADKKVVAASYGPFRRFSGQNGEYRRLSSYPHLAPHLTLFGEDIGLTDCLEWIKDLRFKQLEGKEEGDCLDMLIEFINSGELLPNRTRLMEVGSEGVVFKTIDGARVDAQDLSDGYRSILSIAFDLIRLFVQTYGYETAFANIKKGQMKIGLPGVVVIDEIDAHLHPTWQKRIGYWFTHYFPEVQFIVTTHSPMICQAAEKGTIWRITAPGVGIPSGQVKGKEFERLVYGNVLDSMGTDLFGRNVTRSESSRKMMDRLSKLNLKAIREKLSEEERMELHELRAILSTTLDAGIRE